MKKLFCLLACLSGFSLMAIIPSERSSHEKKCTIVVVVCEKQQNNLQLVNPGLNQSEFEYPKRDCPTPKASLKDCVSPFIEEEEDDSAN